MTAVPAKEYGRCRGSVYIDTQNGNTQRVGWIFERAEKYEDTGQPFIRSVWVVLHEKYPDVERTEHLMSL